MDTVDLGLGSLALGGAGLAGIGHKAIKDIDRVNSGLSDFSRLSQELSPDVRSGKMNFEDVEKGLGRYIDSAKRMAQSRFLGIPVGKVLQYGRPAVEGQNLRNLFRSGLMSLIRRDLTPLQNNLKKYDVAGKHYDMYTNPETSFGEFRQHHLADIAIPDEFNSLLNEHGKRDMSVFDDEAMKIVNDRNNSYRQMVEKLRAGGRTNAADVVSASVLGGQHGNYKAEGLLSKLVAGHEGFEPYINRYKNFGLSAAKPIRMVGKGLLGLGSLGLALGGGGLLAKHAADRDHRTALGLGATAAGIGAAGLGYKAYKDINAPENKNIAISYGEMPAIGHGHKAPGEAIYKILERASKSDPRLRGVNLERIVRNKFGIAGIPKQKEYAININTGFGDSLYPGQVTNPEIGGKSFAIPKAQQGTNVMPEGENLINARKHMAYQTDINPFKPDLASHFPQTPTYMEELSRAAKKFQIPDFDTLSYGPDPGAAGVVPTTGKIHNLTEGQTPAIDPDVISSIMSDNRHSDQVLDDAAKYYETVQQRPAFISDDAGRKAVADQLRSLQGKKLITVAGSGRGDFVGSRAAQLAAALEAHPELKGRYGVLALLADGYEQQKDLLKGAPNTVGLGRVDRDLYNALQSRAHVNWGSSGASALAEALQHNSILALPDRWGTGDLSGIVGKHRDAMNSIGRDLYGEQVQGPITPEIANRMPKAQLDEWNAGGMQHAHTQPGVLKANSVEDIIKALTDENRMKVLTEGVSARRAANHALYNKGQRGLIDTVADTLHEQNAGLKSRGYGRGLAGLGLAGLSAALGYKAQKEPSFMDRIRSVV